MDDRIPAYKRIALGTMTLCSVAVVLMALFSPLDVHRHEVFQKYVGLTSFIAAMAALTFWMRSRFMVHMETPIGQALLRWMPEVMLLLTFLYWLPGAITMADYLVLPWSLPLVDAWLAAPEEALGLTHPVSFAWFERNGLVGPFERIYGILENQILLLAAYYILVKRSTFRLWQYISTLAFAGVASVVPMWAFPARGPTAHYAGEYPVAPPQLDYLIVLDSLRAGEMFDYVTIAGLLSCPSFHTVFALLLIRAWADAPKPLFALAAVANSLVVVSTIPIGSHYLVDIVGGIAWTLMAVFAVDRLADAWLARQGRPAAEADAAPTPS